MAFKGHKLGTGVGYEFMRTIKKEGFAVATLAVPVLLVAIFVMMIAGSSSTEVRTPSCPSRTPTHPG